MEFVPGIGEKSRPALGKLLDELILFLPALLVKSREGTGKAEKAAPESWSYLMNS